MAAWQNLPNELRRTDAELATIGLNEVQALFDHAAKLNVLDEFSELFWDAMNRVRNNPDATSIQQCVNFLEERKRTLGRCYDYSRNSQNAKKYFAIKYNECEYNIRWLVEQYDCTRKTKEYLLEV